MKIKYLFFRYFVNDSFWRKNEGPVFLMIGGEGTANPAWMVEGTWIKYAHELGALCLMLEHRFYGKSHPTRYGIPPLNTDLLVETNIIIQF